MVGFKEFNAALSGFVWGWPMLALIVGSGLYIGIRTGFIQIFEFRYAMKNTIGKAFKKQKSAKGAVTPFQALTTALAATVGTGNIAGITSAVTLGGAGSIFWLWISAIIGMGTKYAEILLAVHYREKNAKGDYVGGPMYTIQNGLGGHFRWLAVTFSIFGAVAAFGVGNAVQVGTMTSSITSAIGSFYPAAAGSRGLINLIIGLAVAVMTALTLFGGVKRIGRVTELIVPFMAALYILASLAVIVVNIGSVGTVFAKILHDAFSPAAALGGAAGISIKTAVGWGFRRGVFSNEAGLGSAPIAHASSSEINPVKQGLYGVFEVFVDTIVLCTLTGLTLLMSGIVIPYGTHGTTALNIASFGTVFGDKAAGVILAVGMSMFALATVFGWALYGTRCAEYLFGTGCIKYYQALYVLVTVAGATVDLESVWQLADTLNGLMAIPNLIAVMALTGVVAKLTKEHFEGHEQCLRANIPKRQSKNRHRA
ncbi:sodium:alanine symporter family protein [Oscillospiraceae bacterium CM]|nr:sodium:alanine symporter family protein [Oscillospiraceae bacterium CM]